MNIASPGYLPLRGITVELEGNEGDIVFAHPVVEVDGGEFVSRIGATGEVELRALADSERDYVRWLSDGLTAQIASGEGVWVAGPQLVTALSEENTAHLFSLLREWGPFRDGFRWKAGTYREYADFMQYCANELEIVLHKALFFQTRGFTIDPSGVLDLYQAFALEDTRERALNSALYYFEAHELARLDLETTDAINAGHVSDAAEFDRLLGRLRSRVLAKRLRDDLLVSPAVRVTKAVGKVTESPHSVRGKNGPDPVKRPGAPKPGTVKWFNAEKGFGFIALDDGSGDVFAHFAGRLVENERVNIEDIGGKPVIRKK